MRPNQKREARRMKIFLHQYFGKLWMGASYLFLYVPLFCMIVFSFNSTRQDAVFTGFSLRWYEPLTHET
jgi:putrescine transport system permease protein